MLILLLVLSDLLFAALPCFMVAFNPLPFLFKAFSTLMQNTLSSFNFIFLNTIILSLLFFNYSSSPSFLFFCFVSMVVGQ